MEFIQYLDKTSADDRPVVGGKAVGLARMTSAGVPVPPGFTVTTRAYLDFVESNDLEPVMDSLLVGIDYDVPDTVEEASRRIRARILSAQIPAPVRTEIEASVTDQGPERFVAVRSSGTAEDMGDASFAGLYDSFLDVRGVDGVVEAVQKCWASLWTARCISYRHRLGIGHRDALVAVVVQEMVAAEVAGVLFTANPLNQRTDEIVINATWGLGEAIASGIVTPDEIILDQETLRVKRRVVGTKEFQIVRDPDGPGTVRQETTAAQRGDQALSDQQSAALAQFGRRAVELAGGIPQDIEWAYREGEFFILQSRDITGAEFLWEEDLEVGHLDDNSDETTWSNIWAQEFWTGAVTPLFYSIRGYELSNSDRRLFALWGFDELVPVRRFKYHRATVYFSSDADRQYYRNVLPSRLRAGRLSNLPPEWRGEAAKANFSLSKFLQMFARMQALTSEHGPLRQVQSVYDFIEHAKAHDRWPSDAELRSYSDDALRRELVEKMQVFEDYLTVLRPAFHVHSPLAFALLNEILDRWYDGTNEYAFADLVTGLPQRTEMLQEQVDLWELGEAIRTSPVLADALGRYEGAGFFAALEDSAEGRGFLERYRDFMALHGHRGHQDRDLWNARRSEDPMIDYRAFQTLVKAAGPSPAEMEEQLVHKRLEATEEVFASIRRRPFGQLRVELVRMLLEYIYRFLVLRDDERPFADLVTMAKKRATTELGRRLYERGLIAHPDDYFFLGYTEIEDVLARRDQPALTATKIRSRRGMFERFVAREEVPADYIRGGVPLSMVDPSETGITGVFQGTGTSRGSISGPARIIPDLNEIGRLQKGDILVCNSTDPGWASAFGLINGLVLEAGGMLSHGACLSREYGLPAVTLSGAMRKVHDGDLVLVDGDTGRVTVLGDGLAAAETEVAFDA